MEDTAMAAAAVAQPQPPRAAGSRRGVFAFLKDGILLVTTRNRGLFLPLAALHAARSLALLAARIVALRYLGPTLGLKANGEDGLPLLVFLDKLLDGHYWLLAAGAACLVVRVAYVVLGLAIRVGAARAAVASIEGGPGPGRTTLTLGSLLLTLRRDLHGAMATAVFVKVVRWASFVAWMLVTLAVISAVEAYAGLISGDLVHLLLHLMATPLVFYGLVACQVAVVVSAAEPAAGLRAGGALRRARRLTRGGKRVAQATLLTMLSWALNRAVWKMYYVAVARLPYSIPAAAATALLWLYVVVVYLLVGAVEVLHTATVTAYYLDCKRDEEEKAAGHIHME